jgi:hypothetical protein
LLATILLAPLLLALLRCSNQGGCSTWRVETKEQ